MYRGKERDRVLRLCGWPAFGDLSQLDIFMEENAVERLATCNHNDAFFFFCYNSWFFANFQVNAKSSCRCSPCHC